MTTASMLRIGVRQCGLRGLQLLVAHLVALHRSTHAGHRISHQVSLGSLDDHAESRLAAFELRREESAVLGRELRTLLTEVAEHRTSGEASDQADRRQSCQRETDGCATSAHALAELDLLKFAGCVVAHEDANRTNMHLHVVRATLLQVLDSSLRGV